MAFGEETGGELVKILVDVKGTEVAVRKIAMVCTETGKLGTAFVKFNAAGEKLGTIWKPNATLMDKFSKGMGGLALRFVGLNAAVSIGIQKFHQLMEWMGTGMQEFRDFERRIAEVSTILGGETIKNVYGLQAGIEMLSKQYGKSANDLAEGTYQILSAAFDAKDALSLLNTATKASIAGLTDVATSVDVFTSILNSYGKSVYQASQVSDVLFQTVVRGKLRFEDLASAMGYITPIAANAGVAFEEVAAALSTVTRMGLRVDMATRGLALGIQDIIDPTEKASKAARQYGVDMSAIALRVKGLEGFIKDLNEAMTDFGASILPEMIANMRSMRVFMALAGDEGIAGFTHDLNLLTKAAGKTEEALAKMMNTAQMESDILAQSMKYLERHVGEAWHSVDIWWRKTQLWWATLFTGGDAGKAVKEFESHINDIKLHYIELAKIQTEYAEKPPLFQKWEEGAKLPSIEDIQMNVDWTSVEEYMGAVSDTSNINNYRNAIGQLRNSFDALTDGGYVLEDEFNEIFNTLSEADKNTLILSGDYDKLLNIFQRGESIAHPYAFVDDVIKQLDATIGTLTIDLEDNANTITRTEYAFKYFAGAIDAATEAINTHTTNILELENAIRDLKVNVEDVYTAMSGDEYVGKLDWQRSLFKEETDLSRSQEYTNMAIKYGKEYINEYNSEIQDAILTLYNYEEAQRKVSETMNAQNKIMAYNNIEMLKLQIAGMKQRRGLSRKQEQEMKQLELSNAEARLAILEDEYANQEDVIDMSHEEAQAEIERYYDMWSHKIYEMKDIRDDELRDMDEDYEYQKGLLDEYVGYLEDEYEALGFAQQQYLLFLQSIDDQYVEEFEETYGVDIPREIQKAIDKMREWHRISGGETGVGETINTEATIGERFEEHAGLLESPILRNIADRMFGRTQDTGSRFIPKDAFYPLQRGEQVIPRGSSKNIVVNVSPTINISGGTSGSNKNEIIRIVTDAIEAGTIRGVQSVYR